MDLNLNGKRVLVTGGSKGIGFACANVFADEGAEVRIASRNPPAGGRFAAKAIDLSRRGAPEELAAWAGDLAILVNNAGAIPGGGLPGVVGGRLARRRRAHRRNQPRAGGDGPADEPLPPAGRGEAGRRLALPGAVRGHVVRPAGGSPGDRLGGGVSRPRTRRPHQRRPPPPRR